MHSKLSISMRHSPENRCFTLTHLPFSLAPICWLPYKPVQYIHTFSKNHTPHIAGCWYTILDHAVSRESHKSQEQLLRLYCRFVGGVFSIYVLTNCVRTTSAAHFSAILNQQTNRFERRKWIECAATLYTALGFSTHKKCVCKELWRYLALISRVGYMWCDTSTVGGQTVAWRGRK